MAQYKVPQDVEADDKLLGPFTFRQFVYLMIAGALIAVCFPLWNLFPALIAIPIPFIFFLGLLALPLKRDQPIETYLSAVLSFHLKPHKRIWEPGEPESTIIISAPKKTDEIHLKNISQEEASHRLSFLAEIVDTEGYAIKNDSASGVRAEVYAEANAVTDIFEAPNPTFQVLQQNNTAYRNEIVDQMRNAIAKNNESHSHTAIIGHNGATTGTAEAYPQLQFNAPAPMPTQAPMPTPPPAPVAIQPAVPDYDFGGPATFQGNAPDGLPTLLFDSPAPVPEAESVNQPTENTIYSEAAPNIAITDPGQDPFAAAQAPNLPPAPQGYGQPVNPFETTYPQAPITSNPAMVDLANNPDYSIETMAQEANRINNKPDSEVFVSLH